MTLPFGVGMAPVPTPQPTEADLIKQAWDQARAQNQAETDALLGELQASGTDDVENLRIYGENLLSNISQQGADALSNFVSQSLLDMDKNRGLSQGETGYRPGYGGLRQFAPVVTQGEVMALPGYSNIQNNTSSQLTYQNKLMNQNIDKSRQNTQRAMEKAQLNSQLNLQKLNDDFAQKLAEDKLRTQQLADRNSQSTGGGTGTGRGGPAPMSSPTDSHWTSSPNPSDLPNNNGPYVPPDSTQPPLGWTPYAQGGSTVQNPLVEAMQRARQKHGKRSRSR